MKLKTENQSMKLQVSCFQKINKSDRTSLVVKNPPANEGDMGSKGIFGPSRSHMLQSN